MTITIYSSEQQVKSTFWGLTYDTWGIIGSVAIPIIVFILGYVINHQINKVKRKNTLIEQINLLVQIGKTKIAILVDQVASLNQFANSIQAMTGTTNENLTLHLFDYNDLNNLDYPEITNAYMLYASGKSADNFTTINGYQSIIIHTTKLYEKMETYMNDFYNDLIFIRTNWNNLNNQINDTKNIINNSQGYADTKALFQQLVVQAQNVENNMPNYINGEVATILGFLVNKHQQNGQISAIELELLTYCIKIRQVFGDYGMVKTKYFNYYDWLKNTMESNKDKLQATLDTLEKTIYLKDAQIFFKKSAKKK